MMRRLLVLLFCCALSAHSAAQVQKLSPKDRRLKRQFEGSIKSNPFVIVMGGVPLGSEYRLLYELKTGKRESQMVGFSAIVLSPIVPIVQAQNQGGRDFKFLMRGFRFQYMYRYFYRKQDEAPLGWYTGAFFSYATGRISIQSWMVRQRYIELNQGHLCMVLGKQTRLFKRVVSDMFFGLGYKQNRVYQHYSNGNLVQYNLGSDEFAKYYLSPVKICAGWNLGLLF